MCKHKLFVISFIAVLLSIAFFSCKNQEPVTPEPTPTHPVSPVSNLNATYSPIDTSITLTWRNPDDVMFTGNELTIVSYSESKIVKLGVSDTSYVVKDSIWGRKFDFSIKSLYKDGISSDKVEITKRLFDESEIPDIPLLYIVTENYEFPTCDYVSAPTGAIGVGIINNFYVNGRMEILQNGSVVFDSGDFKEGDSGMKIRIRGNSSAYNPKKPYKIHLEKKAKLFPEYEDSSADKEYVLLRDVESRVLVGNTIAAAVGLEWQPKCKFVNVVLNGKWNGIYVLSESVKKGKARVNVEDSGFVMENDAYWWNDKKYFKSDHLHLGYTFKYPDEDVLDDSKILPIKSFINEFESYLYNQNNFCFEYIDIKSFAKWLLCHDFLGNGDPCGSNMYIYSRRFFDTTGDLKENKRLFMGPAWDFDGIYVTTDSWSYIRLHNYVFYYTELVKMDRFKEAYVMEYDNVKRDISFIVSNMFDNLIQQNGEAINYSRILDYKRWGEAMPTLEENRDFASKWFINRITWMEDKINQEMR